MFLKFEKKKGKRNISNAIRSNGEEAHANILETSLEIT